MNKFRATGLGLAVSLLMFGTQTQAQDIDLTVERNQISYSVGVNIGQNLVMQGLTEQIDLDAFMAGLRDVVLDQSHASIAEAIRRAFAESHQKKAAPTF
jgi:FKBP-type peptidyl-prolyl cis-trans isomerase